MSSTNNRGAARAFAVSTKEARMSHARTAALICVCALVANAAADPAPAPAPPRRLENKESKMVQENSIVVRRMPNAYFYPFSLWPLPKFPAREHGESIESFHYKRNLNNIQIKQNKR
ncbi:hypothetical protein O0L34_g15362 [Tuta absoluta]|nr:hypothetical protein O0L34_g15362 [Tuta absoluta]